MLKRFADRLAWWHIALFIVAVCALLYGPSVTDKFVSLDDGLLITDNPAIQELSPATLKRVFTTYDPELYDPLTLMTYQVEHALFGFRPGVFHLDNLILHTLNALLVFAVMLQLFRRKGVAAATALLFAVHPLQTEAVLWAAARKDLLSTFFFLSSLGSYLLWREREEKWFSFFSVALFVLGLFAKVTVITLPIVLLLIDWKRHRSLPRAVAEKWPYWLAAIIFGIVAIFGKREVLADSGLWSNFLLACKSAVFYLWHLLIPTGFTIIYPQHTPVTLAAPEFLVPVLIVLALVAVIIASLRRFPVVSFALAFYLVTLVPNFTNFVKDGVTYFASDRYAYIPSIGIFLLVALAVAWLYEHKPFGKWGARAIDAVVICVFVGLIGLARVQADTWIDSETLYTQALSIAPSTLAYNNLGDFYMKNNRPELAKDQFIAAISLDPTYERAYNNLGNYYRDQGDYEEAMRVYRQAIKSLGAGPITSIEYLAPYYYLGETLELLGRSDEALKQFEAAVARAPDRAEPHYNLGLQLEKSEKTEGATAEYQKAVAIDPGYIPAQYHLAGLLAESGKLQEAAAALEAVVRVNPNYEKATEHLQDIRALLRGQ